MLDLADGFYRRWLDSALFIRAQRKPDGRRSFRLEAGEPQTTSSAPTSTDRCSGPPQRIGPRRGVGLALLRATPVRDLVDGPSAREARRVAPRTVTRLPREG